MNQLTSDAALV